MWLTRLASLSLGACFALPQIGAKSYLDLYALFGFGATNFSTGTDIGTINGFETAFLAKHPGFVGTVDAGDAIQKSVHFRAGGFSTAPYANAKYNDGWLFGTQVECFF